MSAFNNLPLEDGRRGLLRWIGDSRPQGSVNKQVTVVFDGHPAHCGGNFQGDIRVIFSDGCSADDQIKYMVEEDHDRKNCVVVSDDKDIFIYARSLGARVMSVPAFTATKTVRQNKAGRNQGSVEKYISLVRQEKITKEFFQRWVGDKQ